MSRTCELTGKTVMTGNNVSHAKNRNKRVFRPNLVNTTLMSEVLDRSFSFRVATSAIRTVEHNGGLDNYLLKAKDEVLSAKARKVRKEIRSKKAAA
ncbi:MAG: 50S ribosomal protein L28 [Proteobacteria bacterium]|nr:50S ribosomal protein L28 [Pseudomonadota bacterium]